MKKFIALAIAILMLATLALPTFAATAGTTTVKYSVGETYTIVVPAEITASDDTTEIAIAVDDYNLLSTNKVTVTADSTWKMNDAANTQFKLNKTTFDFTADATQNAVFSWVSGAPTVAGSYTGTISFTSAIVAK